MAMITPMYVEPFVCPTSLNVAQGSSVTFGASLYYLVSGTRYNVTNEIMNYRIYSYATAANVATGTFNSGSDCSKVTYTPSAPGVYGIFIWHTACASWDATSPVETQITVRANTVMTLAPSTQTPAYNSNVTINGTLKTSAGANVTGVTVTLRRYNPSGSLVSTDNVSVTNGTFSITYPTGVLGTWTVSGSFAATTTYNASTATTTWTTQAQCTGTGYDPTSVIPCWDSVDGITHYSRRCSNGLWVATGDTCPTEPADGSARPGDYTRSCWDYTQGTSGAYVTQPSMVWSHSAMNWVANPAACPTKVCDEHATRCAPTSGTEGIEDVCTQNTWTPDGLMCSTTPCVGTGGLYGDMPVEMITPPGEDPYVCVDGIKWICGETGMVSSGQPCEEEVTPTPPGLSPALLGVLAMAGIVGAVMIGG